MNLNNLRDKAFATATAKGFHDKEYSNEHWLMLVITELSESVEADRKGRRANVCEFNMADEAMSFKTRFENFIKGSVEEELADAAIRLLDLAGLNNVHVYFSGLDFEWLSNGFKDKTFTECIYRINGLIFMLDVELKHEISDTIVGVLSYIIALSKHLDIDLLWHIEKKMKYNETREPLHGKKY